MKKAGTFICVCFALLAAFPVFFLAAGSLMGAGELKELLQPVLTGGEEFASWKLFPRYPTLRSYVELLLDSPEFFVMFWNSVKLTGGILVGQLLVGVPAAWGFARFSFPGKKLFLSYILPL